MASCKFTSLSKINSSNKCWLAWICFLDPICGRLRPYLLQFLWDLTTLCPCITVSPIRRNHAHKIKISLFLWSLWDSEYFRCSSRAMLRLLQSFAIKLEKNVNLFFTFFFWKCEKYIWPPARKHLNCPISPGKPPKRAIWRWVQFSGIGHSEFPSIFNKP